MSLCEKYFLFVFSASRICVYTFKILQFYLRYICCCASTNLQKLKIGFKEKIRSFDSEEENDNWEDAHSVGSAFSYNAPAVKNCACIWEYHTTQEIIDEYRAQENDVAAFLKKNKLTHEENLRASNVQSCMYLAIQ